MSLSSELKYIQLRGDLEKIQKEEWTTRRLVTSSGARDQVGAHGDVRKLGTAKTIRRSAQKPTGGCRLSVAALPLRVLSEASGLHLGLPLSSKRACSWEREPNADQGRLQRTATFWSLCVCSTSQIYTTSVWATFNLEMFRKRILGKVVSRMTMLVIEPSTILTGLPPYCLLCSTYFVVHKIPRFG